MIIEKKTLYGCLFLILSAVLFPAQAMADEGKIQASIFPIEGQPFIVENFTIDDKLFYDAEQGGKGVRLNFRDLKEIKFQNPGRNYEVEVAFTDGRKDLYMLQPASNINIVSQHSYVSMSHSKIVKIVFSTSDRTTQAASPSHTEASNATGDQVFLKNGVILSGHIQVKAFPLRTIHGRLEIPAPQIVIIDYEARGPGLGMVLLRNGDRISGTIDLESLSLLHENGKVVHIESKTIKLIQFRR